MSDCDHNALPDAVVYKLLNPTNPLAAPLWSVHVAVRCTLCGQAFRFLGNNALAPETPQEAQRSRLGAWVTGTADELACMIAPIEPGEALADIAVAGRA